MTEAKINDAHLETDMPGADGKLALPSTSEGMYQTILSTRRGRHDGHPSLRVWHGDSEGNEHLIGLASHRFLEATERFERDGELVFETRKRAYDVGPGFSVSYYLVVTEQYSLDWHYWKEGEQEPEALAEAGFLSDESEGFSTS